MDRKSRKTEASKNRAGKGIAHQIQSKIRRVVSLVFQVVGIIAVVLVYSIITKDNNTTLSLESVSASYELSAYFEPFERMTEQQAINPEVQLFMRTLALSKNTKKHSGYPDILKSLQNIQKLDEENILSAWISDLDASVLITSDGFISDESWDITSRPWFKCIEQNQILLTVPYEDSSTGENVITVACPVFDSAGNALGVSGIDIRVHSIQESMKHYIFGDNGFAVLIASDGTIIYHPDEQLVESNLRDTGITQRVIDMFEAKEDGLVKFKVLGESRHGYMAAVGDTGYVVLSSISQGEFYSSLILMVGILIGIFVAGIIVISLVIKKAADHIVEPLTQLNQSANELARGNFDVHLEITSEDEIGELGESFLKTVSRLKEYINYIDEIAQVLTNIADGKLTVHLKYDYAGEFEKVKHAMLHISSSMTGVMQNIMESANQVSAGSDDLARAAQGLAEGAESQAASIEELLATTTAVVEQVEENQKQAVISAKQTKEITEMMGENEQMMNQMMEAMDKIMEASRQVVGIITAIEDIAEQTNLLSLNASIEAARAGEAGRGFAVVASEIGKLAQESGNAVNTTRNLIGVSIAEIEKGNALAGEVVESLKKAVAGVEETNVMIQKTADDAKAQMQNMLQIQNGVEIISHGIQDNSAMAEETSATSEELAAQAVTLNDLVQRFDLK